MKKLFISTFIASLASISFANALDYTALKQACEFKIEDGDAYIWAEPNCIKDKAHYNDTSFKNMIITPFTEIQIADALCGGAGQQNYETSGNTLTVKCNDGEMAVAKIAKRIDSDGTRDMTDAKKQVLEYCKSMRKANGQPEVGSSAKKCTGITDEDGEWLIKVGKQIGGVADIYKEGDGYVISYDGE